MPLERQEASSCVGPQAELFFSEDDGDVESAKRLCAGCPGRVACLAGAVARREPWGVWGGELLQAGVVVRRKRPRGRPRKDRSIETTRSADASRGEKRRP